MQMKVENFALTTVPLLLQIFPQSAHLLNIWLILAFVNPTLNAFIYAGRLETFKKSWAALIARFK
jgi:hypothetical protein